jgi:predicted DNA-binding protein (UPF0251 family)/phage FluMu protein Com
MARPKQSRRVFRLPLSSYYRPRGISTSTLEEVVVSVDELEAMRLADHDGLYHAGAAEKMNVSRQTFGRILGAARKKVAGALVEGKALRIEGGEIEMVTMKRFACSDCGNFFEMPHGKDVPMACPSCKSLNILRAPEKRGQARRRRRGQGEFGQGGYGRESR